MGPVKKVEDIVKEGFIIRNVPYNEYDYPCNCGCGEPMKSRSTAVITRVIFLVKKYMIENNLTEFDYNQFSLIDEEFKKYWYEDRKKQKNNSH
ncbi:hypothetical protein [Bacillus cereus]|uniref:hypothetical protein n=1 Tax=Bacillus cereus TaxID=1396 RepID=UPI000B4ACE46|nr:hypothetical protein [Bacillus cereus]